MSAQPYANDQRDEGPMARNLRLASEGIEPTAEQLAEGWQDSADRCLRTFSEESVRSKLAQRLIYHLAVIELPWAREAMRQASQIRAEQIVSQIGWPRRTWLDPRVAQRVASFNEVHARRVGAVR
jgi:hypothetical protein